MGKKSGRGGEKKEEGAAKAAQPFVLKVVNHCSCTGCKDKIRAAVNDLTLLHGIDALNRSALESHGEVTLLATADPKKLQQRLRKATNKHVDLLFPKEPKPDKAAAADKDATAAMAEAPLLKILQAQYAAQQQQQQGAWANQLLAGAGAGAGGAWNAHGSYGYGAAAAQAYPWGAPQPDPYAAAYPYSSGVAYPAAAGGWGAYAYPPVAQGHGGGAWHGHGGY